MENKDIYDETAFFGLTERKQADQRREERRNLDANFEYYRRVNEASDKRGGIVSYPSHSAINQNTSYENSVSVKHARQTANKTIGSNKQTKVNTKTPVKNSSAKVIDTTKLTKKIAPIILAVSIITSTAVGTYALFGDKIMESIETKIETTREIKENRNLFEDKALNNLLNNGLAYLNGKNEIVVKENSVDDYWKLNISSKYDIYGYSLVLSTSEFNKFIQTVSYNNGIWNYTGTNNFLTYNGYTNPKDNNPSMEVFQNLMEEKIQKIPKETIDRYAKEYSVLTFEDMLAIIEAEQESQSKGGK